jgi:hypothetical protein
MFQRCVLPPSSSLMMEAVHTSETSVDNYFTRQYIPEENSEHKSTFSLAFCITANVELHAIYMFCVLLIMLSTYYIHASGQIEE